MAYKYEDILPFQVLQREPGKDFALVSKDELRDHQFKIGGPHYYYDGYGKPFYVGDIWVMAGGSNMQGLGYEIDFFTMEELQQPVTHDAALLYDSSEHWRRFRQDPSHELDKSPRVVHRQAVGIKIPCSEMLQHRGASLAPAFVNAINEINSGMPIGLVACAKQNSTIDDWETDSKDPNKSLYGAMLDKIKKVGGRIAGVLWYQGESDAFNSATAKIYGDLFQAWVFKLRKDLNQPNLPVVFVQIGPYNLESCEFKINWKKIQAAQFKMFGKSSYTAGVTSLDTMLDDSCNLSASGLSLVGRRLAFAADKAMKGEGASATPLLLTAYRQRLSWNHKSHPLDIMSIYLKFKHLSSPWKLEPDQPVVGFSFGNFMTPIIRAFVVDAKKGSVRLYLHQVIEGPLVIHYGMQLGRANLVTQDGRALPAFANYPV